MVNKRKYSRRWTVAEIKDNEKRIKLVKQYKELFGEIDYNEQFVVHYEYVSTWIGKYGDVKIKRSIRYPQVRCYHNPYNGKRHDALYKTAEIGDMDYYGWFLINIHKQAVLVKRDHLEVEFIENHTFSKSDYDKMLKKHRKAMRKKAKKV